MNYKVNLAARMLFNKRGSLAGAILAVTIGILVIHVNFVIFQGLFDAIVRDYNIRLPITKWWFILITSHLMVTITKSDLCQFGQLVYHRNSGGNPAACLLADSYSYSLVIVISKCCNELTFYLIAFRILKFYHDRTACPSRSIMLRRVSICTTAL